MSEELQSSGRMNAIRHVHTEVLIEHVNLALDASDPGDAIEHLQFLLQNLDGSKSEWFEVELIAKKLGSARQRMKSHEFSNPLIAVKIESIFAAVLDLAFEFKGFYGVSAIVKIAQESEYDGGSIPSV